MKISTPLLLALSLLPAAKAFAVVPFDSSLPGAPSEWEVPESLNCPPGDGCADPAPAPDDAQAAPETAPQQEAPPANVPANTVTSSPGESVKASVTAGSDLNPDSEDTDSNGTPDSNDEGSSGGGAAKFVDAANGVGPTLVGTGLVAGGGAAAAGDGAAGAARPAADGSGKVDFGGFACDNKSFTSLCGNVGHASETAIRTISGLRSFNPNSALNQLPVTVDGGSQKPNDITITPNGN